MNVQPKSTDHETFIDAVIQAAADFAFCSKESVKAFLTIPGIAEILLEEFNNDALEILSKKQLPEE